MTNFYFFFKYRGLDFVHPYSGISQLLRTVPNKELFMSSEGVKLFFLNKTGLVCLSKTHKLRRNKISAFAAGMTKTPEVSSTQISKEIYH